MKVDKQSCFNTGQPQVRDELRFVDGLQALDRLDFYDELALHHEVETVAARQSHAFVLDGQGFLTLKVYTSQIQLMGEKLLVRRLEQPRPNNSMNLDACANDLL